MAINIGQFGNIVEDFEKSLNQIFGGATNPGRNKGGRDLFNPAYGGSVVLDESKWLGNTRGPKVRYGFMVLDLSEIKSASGTKATPISSFSREPYYLDIPPQSIKQKEVFATNITATRKGIIVESEGVVFKDIVIQGTTGVFPGPRGGSNAPTSNLFSDPFRAPTSPAGVDPNTGRSRATGITTISGYEEFMRLRQYFLKYASEKVRRDGNLFLVFINEKDDQALIVEPLEFEMERNSKSPLTYQYRIVLKAIGNLNTIFEGTGSAGRASGFLGVLEDVGNLSANVSASITQSRAVIAQSTRLLTRLSQSFEQTFVNPLRQVQFAMRDLSDGISTVLSLPEVIARNATSSTLDIAESTRQIGGSMNEFSVSTATDQETRLAQTATFQQQQAIKDRLLTDNKVPTPRSALERVVAASRSLSDDLADFTNLGDPLYDTIKGRVATQTSSVIKTVSDDEFMLLGTLQELAAQLTLALASNGMFAADAEVAFERAQEQFESEDVPDNFKITIPKPNFVREVVIARNDILERIAQREYGDANRWVDLVVLNNLKPPYIDAAGGEGVLKPGDKILVGDK